MSDLEFRRHGRDQVTVCALSARGRDFLEARGLPAVMDLQAMGAVQAAAIAAGLAVEVYVGNRLEGVRSLADIQRVTKALADALYRE